MRTCSPNWWPNPADQGAAGQAARRGPVRRLRRRTLLIVLDNCEHIVHACAELTERLLRGSESVRVLATSRERLRLTGETVWRVPPLSAPDAGTVSTVDALGSYD